MFKDYAYGHSGAVRRKGGNLTEQPRERESHQRHYGELRYRTYQYVKRTLRQKLEIMRCKSESHGEHDYAQNYSLHITLNPGKKTWEKECHHSSQYNKQTSLGA